MSQRRLRPKLVVDGADAAIAFYEAVLGARTVSRFTMGGAVVLAELELPSGDALQVKDVDRHDPAPPEGGGGVVLDVECDDPDAVAALALERGAQLVFEVADQPYGARQGRFRDPFGHQWIVGTPSTMSDAGIQAALDRWAADA
ncbi:MAG: glyoxalase [Acidobacteria bacterium]|nr:MAG: glyoxalase [Acidobacteriota bacterium]